jgi:hypothetical protein
MTPNTNAVIRVGDGRGFVIEHDNRCYVITASHCLTRPLEVRRVVDEENEHAVLPPPMPFMYDAERLYPKLLGTLDGECRVCAECLFVDPVADIAVLGQPDSQALWEQAVAYDNLVEGAESLRIGELPPARREHRLPDGAFFNVPGKGEIDARLLSLDGRWFSCRVHYQSMGAPWIAAAAEPISGGMSGSPIVSEDATAIGVVCVRTDTEGVRTDTEGVGTGGEGGPNPCLARHLPGWLLRTT